MPAEPVIKRVIAFFDGQNLFHTARNAFGCKHPNYDPTALVDAIANQQGWTVAGIRFYTGIPDPNRGQHDAFWHHFWTAKLANMGRRGIFRFTRVLRYTTENIPLADGTTTTVTLKQEKGIDVRIALDVVRLALDNQYDVALIFSQDQDLSEVADEVRAISVRQDRWIHVASAFPHGAGNTNRRGIDHTSWIRIDQSLYDACIDQTDYRPRTR